MTRFLISIFLLIVSKDFVSAQGRNNTWLLGYENWVTKATIQFDLSSYQLTTGPRSIGFEGSEETISDEQGNLFMSSNGTWIANANHDTMMNGAGLNPGYYVNTWPAGLVIPYGNIILPYPGDSLRYVIFHQTRLDPNSFLHGIYKTVIDITLDSGLGGVIEKNDTLFTDSLSWGLAACKHGNGRDWWIIAQKDSSDILYKIFF